MELTEQQQNEFEQAARPLIRFLNEHCTPRAKVIVDFGSARIYIGEHTFATNDYVDDRAERTSI